MGIALAEAAKQVGISRVGLLKSIKRGKVTAEKNVHGEWEIEPAELFRAYPPVKQVTGDKIDEVTVSNTLESKMLQDKIDAQREQINDLREQLAKAEGREAKILKMMDEQITNMRMLTDQRTGNRTGFWSSLFGKN